MLSDCHVFGKSTKMASIANDQYRVYIVCMFVNVHECSLINNQIKLIFQNKMKSALVVLLIAILVVPGMTRNVIFNDYLAARRCPTPACDGKILISRQGTLCLGSYRLSLIIGHKMTCVATITC